MTVISQPCHPKSKESRVALHCPARSNKRISDQQRRFVALRESNLGYYFRTKRVVYIRKQERKELLAA